MNRYLLGAIAWAIIILILTLTPGKSVPDISLFDYDKIGHAGIFFIFSFLLITGLYKMDQRPQRVAKVVVIGLVSSVVYGFAIEFIQDLIPDRGMEWYDAVANILGSILGVCLFYVRYKQTAWF